MKKLGSVILFTSALLLGCLSLAPTSSVPFLITNGKLTNTLNANNQTISNFNSTGLTANPSATVGLTAVNGSAPTFMTSDSAPALSQSITPTWTGNHTFNGSRAIQITPTWNDPAFTFYGLFENVTNTQSFSASRLMELEVGGVDKFNIDLNGRITANGGLTTTSIVQALVLGSTGSAYASISGLASAGEIFYITDAKTTNCSDSACNVGATVTGGTGSLKKLIWYNGTAFTVIGQ